MPSNPEPKLSDAERAVAAILRRGWANGRGPQVPIEDRARELVAAAHHAIAAEVLESAADCWADNDGFVSMSAGRKAEEWLREQAARFRHVATRQSEEGQR